MSSTKGFIYGLTTGLVAGFVSQMMIAKNQEQMLEIVKNIPRPLRFGPEASIDELMAQKERLEELLRLKQQEAGAMDDEEPDAV